LKFIFIILGFPFFTGLGTFALRLKVFVFAFTYLFNLLRILFLGLGVLVGFAMFFPRV